jgi:hypothetical protein
MDLALSRCAVLARTIKEIDKEVNYRGDGRAGSQNAVGRIAGVSTHEETWLLCYYDR